MANIVVSTSRLEAMLQSKWTEFVDKSQLMRTVLEDARDSEYRRLDQEPPSRKLKISVTFHSSSGPSENYEFEIWTEFTVPDGNGARIGTHLYSLTSNGEIRLKESYGTHFLPENP